MMIAKGVRHKVYQGYTASSVTLRSQLREIGEQMSSRPKELRVNEYFEFDWIPIQNGRMIIDRTEAQDGNHV